MKKDTFLITGGNFNNKGAQAMLFVTVSELRDRFPDCEIIVETFDVIPAHYKFLPLRIWSTEWKSFGSSVSVLYYYIRKSIKSIVRRDHSLKEYIELINTIKGLTAIVDISGFHLSSQWGNEISDTYLDRIKAAKRFHVPVFLMPQSFGPFDYEKDSERIRNKIRKYLQYPKVIFAREKSAYDLLVEEYQLNNIRHSCDLVLQNRDVNYDSVDEYEADLSNIIVDAGSVAIIPNMRNFDHGNKVDILEAYSSLIELLQYMDKKIYILRHSGEDIKACKMIYERLNDKTNVFVVSDELNCIEFNHVIRSFDYVIASRYHSIIHSYKNGVPTIVMGWAEKYHELLSLFGQEKYMIDVRERIDCRKLETMVKRLEDNFLQEKQRIRKGLAAYQNSNCFDSISEELLLSR